MPTKSKKPASPKAKPNHIPAEWPKAFGLYKFSRDAVKVNWEAILILVLLNFAISSICSKLGDVGSILSLITYSVFGVLLALEYLAGARAKRLPLGQVWQKAPALLYVKFFVVSIIVTAALVFSLFLLVVPFLFVLPRVLLVPYFLVDRNMGITEALRASWQAASGNSGKLWGIIGANIAMALLIVTIIGIPFAVYFLFMYSAALPIAYLFINGQQQHDRLPKQR